MSKAQDREYILNVAQQFLQGIDDHINPLTSASWFREVCGSDGQGIGCFYNNHVNRAENFLKKFSGRKLQLLIIGSVSPQDDPHLTGFSSSSIPHSSMRILAGREKVWDFFDSTGQEILCRLAAVSLLAAAYD